MPVKSLKIDCPKLFRKIFLIVFFIILPIVIVAGIIYLPSYLRLRKLRNENKRILNEIAEIEKEIRIFKYNLKELEDNPYILEKIAREDIGVMKEEEIVIDIKD